MAHKLIKLLNSLYNTPHLIESSSFGNIVSYLEDRSFSNKELAITPSKYKGQRKLNYDETSKIGVISVDGPLTYISYAGLCEEESVNYQAIQEQFDELLEAGAKTIILDVDSPGGEAYGAFETGSYMRSRADSEGIQFLSYVDGLAASAGYVLASSAHKVITNPFAELGSIGVLVKLRNTNKKLQKEGIEDTFITAGESKVPFDAKGDFTKSFLEDIQSKVDELYVDFVDYVSEMRGMATDVVKNTEAKVFTAKTAVDLGLADEIMTREEFMTYLSSIVNSGNMKFNLNTNKKGPEMAQTETEGLAELSKELDGIKQSVASLSAALSAKETELSTTTAKLTEALAELSVLKESAASLKAKAEADKQAARKASLAAVLDAEKAESVYTKLSGVSDEVFELALDGYKAAFAAEKESPAFKEQGVSGEGKTQTKDDAAARTLAVVKAKYQKQ